MEILMSNLKVRFLTDNNDPYSFGGSEKELKAMGTPSRDCEQDFGIYNHQNYRHWVWAADSFENINAWNDKVTELRFTMTIIKRECKDTDRKLVL